MKNWREFLAEGELEDLRRDLIGLGFTRWEVLVWGVFEAGEWSVGFSSRGKGDTKEEAAEFALSAILDVIYSSNLVGKKVAHQMQHEIGGIGDFREFEERYGIASDLVQKTLSDSLYTKDLYRGIYTNRKLDVAVQAYEGLESGGIIKYERYP